MMSERTIGNLADCGPAPMDCLGYTYSSGCCGNDSYRGVRVNTSPGAIQMGMANWGPIDIGASNAQKKLFNWMVKEHQLSTYNNLETAMETATGGGGDRHTHNVGGIKTLCVVTKNKSNKLKIGTSILSVLGNNASSIGKCHARQVVC